MVVLELLGTWREGGGRCWEAPRWRTDIRRGRPCSLKHNVIVGSFNISLLGTYYAFTDSALSVRNAFNQHLPSQNCKTCKEQAKL